MAVEREVLDWGVRLSARPFTGDNAALTIKSEVAVWKPGKGSEVRITFSGTSMVTPLRLLDAQTWNEALSAIIAETRTVIADMRAEAADEKSKKRR